MRKYILLPLCAAYILFMGGSLASCNSNAKDELAHHHHDHGHHGHDEHDHDHEGHDHDHEDYDHDSHKHTGKEIVVEPEVAKEFGVQVETVTPGSFNNVTKVSGRILESPSGASVASSPSSGTVTFTSGINEGKQVSAGTLIATVKTSATTGGDANAAAKANLDAAKRELERVRPLHEHGIVSTAEFNAALAAYENAKALYSPSASSGRITAPAAGTITQLAVKNGQFVEAGAPVAYISGSSTLTLRADIPQRLAGKTAEFTGARLRTAYSPEVFDLSDMGARRVDGNGLVSSRPGYIPLYFDFSNNGQLVAGTPVEVFLQGAPRSNVISVPVSALSEQQGKFFVFVQVDDECYLKRPVTLGENDGRRVEIISGIEPGDKVVSSGMMAIRLAESSGVVPEGHSHSH